MKKPDQRPISAVPPVVNTVPVPKMTSVALSRRCVVE